ncbi:hypothetical protein LTS18_007260, partial [Coniosporium uncinatum]
VVIPARPTPAAATTPSGQATAGAAATAAGFQQLDGSAPGSVDDDADDESGSELSDLEDEIVVQRPPALLFPNLMPHGGRTGEAGAGNMSAYMKAEQGDDEPAEVGDDIVDLEEGDEEDQKMEDAE